MNTAKVYHDTNGNECTIHQMVEREPYWAAVRIQVGEQAISEVEYYQGVLNAAINLLCDAFERDTNDYDRDQADGECYLDCVRDAAEAIKQFGIKWDDDEGRFAAAAAQQLNSNSA